MKPFAGFMLSPFLFPLLFDDAIHGIAVALGTTDVTAGYMIGGIFTAMVVVLLAGFGTSERVILIFAGLCTALSVLFGWYPPWVVIFLVILLAVLLFRWGSDT